MGHAINTGTDLIICFNPICSIKWKVLRQLYASKSEIVKKGFATERKVTKAILVLVLFLAAAVSGIRGRDLPAEDEVYSPQHLLGLGDPFGIGLGLGRWPIPFLKLWLGGCCGLPPWLGPPKAEGTTKGDASKSHRSVPMTRDAGMGVVVDISMRRVGALGLAALLRFALLTTGKW